MKPSGTLLLLLLGLAIASIGLPAIYKWIDEEGSVYYSDTPPSRRNSETVDIAPSPPASTTTGKQTEPPSPPAGYAPLPVTAPKEAGPTHDTGAAQAAPESRTVSATTCFTAITAAWEGRVTDTRQGVSRSPLQDEAFLKLQKLLHALKGRWEGNIEDITCISPTAVPAHRTDNYRVRLSADFHSRQLFEITAELEGDKGTRAVLQWFFRLLNSREGLRFISTQTNTLSELDLAGNDVELLQLTDDELTFYWRRGGTVRRATIFSLQKNGRTFTINEYFYAQGVLTGKRLWTLEK